MYVCVFQFILFMFETQITKQQASASSISLFTAIRDKHLRPIEKQLFSINIEQCPN